MVNVGVRKEHVINRPSIEREMRVSLIRFRAVPLHHPAVEEDPRAVDLQQVHRAGDFARRALESQIHRGEFRDNGIGERVQCEYMGAVGSSARPFYHKEENNQSMDV